MNTKHITDKAERKALKRKARKEAPPRAAAGYGDFETVMNVVADAVRTPHYLLGDRFTAADVIIGSQLGWGMLFGVIPKRDEFVGYMGRIQERPAWQRALGPK